MHTGNSSDAPDRSAHARRRRDNTRRRPEWLGSKTALAAAGLPPARAATSRQSAALLELLAGFQRRMGRRAAVTSSTLLVRVECGAVLTSCGSDSTSLAIEIIALINRSSSCLLSVSVGSIMRAPRTIRGKLTV